MKTRKLISPLIVLAFACSFAPAGEVYGKLTEAGAPVSEAAAIEAKCGEKTYPAVKTDKSGSYRVILAESGKCTLKVNYKNQSASLDIASYDDAVQVDLVVELKDGKLAVRRK